MKRSNWLKPQIRMPKLPAETEEDKNVVVDSGPENYVQALDELMATHGVTREQILDALRYSEPNIPTREMGYTEMDSMESGYPEPSNPPSDIMPAMEMPISDYASMEIGPSISNSSVRENSSVAMGSGLQVAPGSIAMGMARAHINGRMLASFPADQIEGMSPRNNALGPGSPIYYQDEINPIGFVVSMVTNFDYNRGNAWDRQIVASIDNIFIQV